MDQVNAVSPPAGMSRRGALRALGSGLGALTLLPLLSPKGVLAFERLQQAEAVPNLLALDAAQYAAVEAFSEAIIPADDRSPGAKAARVADYIDLLLSESDEPLRQAWFDGLAALDTAAVASYGAPFVGLAPTQVEAFLATISGNEAAPTAPVERFFRTTKDATIRGYYTSAIGIHQELRYKGNRPVPAFVGCLVEDGQACPHCGQRP